MLPIASSNGPAFIGVVVIGAALFLWWLLRSESRDEAAAKAERESERKAEEQTTPVYVQQAAPETEEDRLSAP
jgi:hypothetical protein